MERLKIQRKENAGREYQNTLDSSLVEQTVGQVPQTPIPNFTHNFGDISVFAPEHTVQRKATSDRGVDGADFNLSARIQSASGTGIPLEQNVQTQLETGIGADLSGVRIHDNSEADQLSRELHANAFTTGDDIFFRQGLYNPSSGDGMRLLAHEATHTVQQASGAVDGVSWGGVKVSEPNDRFERAAEATANNLSNSSDTAAPTGGSSSTGVVQRASSDGLMIQRDPNTPTINVPPVVITDEPPSNAVTISPVTVYGEVPQQAANTTIVGDATPGAYTREVEQSMNRLADRADANAVKYGQHIQFAFEAFQNYAEPKLGDMSITEDDVAEFIVGKGIEIIAGQVTAGLTGGIGAKIGIFIVDKVKEKLISSAKVDKVGSLKTVIKQMGQTGRDGATVIQSAVANKINPLVATIRTKCSSNQEFTPAEQEFIDNFTYVEDPAAFNAAIATLGVPDTTDAVKLQLDIFQALVERFEVKYILANASWGEKISYGAAAITGDDSHSLDKDAKKAAQNARQERGKSIQPN